tara:strand:+ start:216 stop:1595 length:1380 start_codon:yes stop_codon:yes gene_type:complete
MNIKSFDNIYLIGIGGIGMSSLARFFVSQDKKVFGYDKVKTSLTIELENQGIEISYKDDIDTIPSIFNQKNEDQLVIYSSAISNNNIFSFFSNNRFPICKRADALGLISKYYYTIAIAGTHGKTTTSIMLSHILKSSDVDCTAFFGGISKNYKTNFLLSETSKYMIVEADEYDKSFLTLSPDIAVITSLDADHLDVYNSHEEFVNTFQEFIFQVKENGYLIIEESIVNYFKKPKNVRLLTYSSSSSSDYYISEINQKDNSFHFTYHTKDTSVNSKDIVLPMLGKHNLSNALAAISVSDLLNINYNSISSSFSNFEGINRRFDIHISNKKTVYIDDYAHHPEEIKSTINGIIESFPQRKLTVIFQPHLFSRTKDFAKDFAQSLSLADELILLDIYPAREEPIAGVDSKMLLDLCTNDSKIIFKNNELLSYLKDNKSDVVVTLGAGNISDLVKPIVSILDI